MFWSIIKPKDYLSNHRTMGNVVPVADMIAGIPAKKILCNKEPSKFLPEDLFDKVYYESIESAMTKIEDDISSWWES